jgi:hypothetical protein
LPQYAAVQEQRAVEHAVGSVIVEVLAEQKLGRY